MAISLVGIALLERNAAGRPSSESANEPQQRTVHAHFEWLEIENLCYSKHTLCVTVRRPAPSLRAKDGQRVKYKLKMDGRK